MTLRDLFNTIMDYPFDTEIQLDPWGLLASLCIAVFVLIVLFCWFDRKNDGDNGWYI